MTLFAAAPGAADEGAKSWVPVIRSTPSATFWLRWSRTSVAAEADGAIARTSEAAVTAVTRPVVVR
ncbi:hypothetical protein [Streptomyces sp. PA5.6]|uniref:hypothetical protein n=1 Tax=Streptomyces sp. PA5.6 TaxID=3035651 RepID=UPI0039046735